MPQKNQTQICYAWEEISLHNVEWGAKYDALSKKEVKGLGAKISKDFNFVAPSSRMKKHWQTHFSRIRLILFGLIISPAPTFMIKSGLKDFGENSANMFGDIASYAAYVLTYVGLPASFIMAVFAGRILLKNIKNKECGAHYLAHSNKIEYFSARGMKTVIHEHAHALVAQRIGKVGFKSNGKISYWYQAPFSTTELKQNDQHNGHCPAFVGVVARMYARYYPELPGGTEKQRERFLLDEAAEAGLDVIPYDEFVQKYPANALN